MGKRFLEWLSAILVICCVPVFGQDCGNTTYNGTTGTINLVDAGKGKNCTYFIVAGNSAPQVAIIFPAASLDPSIYNLTVYAGNETTSPVISNLTQVLPGQPFVVVISSYNVTKIVLSHGDKEGTAPSLAVTYNTTGCLAPAQSIGGIFPSPYYLPNNGTVNCTYIGTVQAQRLGVLSFTKMNVTSGKVDVKFGSSNLTPVITGTTVPADMFGAVDETITLNFTFDSKTDVQSFQAIFQSVSPDCSGVKTASSGLTKLAIPQSNQLPVTCYTRIEAPDNNQVYITDGGKYTQATGIDSIVYFDGSNTNSSVIGSVSDGFSWHVSSGKYLTIIASLRAQGSRTTDIQYKSDASSKYYQVTDKTAVVVDGATAKGSQVSLTFASQNSSLGNLKFELNSTSVLNDAVITVQCEGAMTMFTFTKDTALIPVVMPSSVAFVIINKLNGSATVSLTITAIQKSDCDQILASPSGDVLLVAANTTQKTCNILVTAASDIILDLSQVNLCETGKLDIYQGFNKSSPLLATLTAGTPYPNMAPIKFPAGAGPRLVWTDDKYKCLSPTVVGRYWTQTNDSICGSLGSSLSGTVQTPNYPNQYPLNVLCNWTIPAVNNSILYLMVNKQDFQPGQNVTVQNTTATFASINGTADAALPGDFMLPNTNLSLLFRSGSQGQTLDLTQSGQGAQLTYKIITCGGVVDKVGNLNIPDAKNKTVECIWVIRVPATGVNNSVNIVNASFSVTGYQNTSNGSLNVYDGNSMRDSPLLVNMTTKMSTTNILSRSNSLLVRFTYTNNTSGGPFNLTISFDAFNCNKSSQCDNGTCMHPDWRCDGKPQCKDGTDERNCNGSQPIPPVTTPVPPEPHKGDETKGVAGYWVFVCLVIGIIVGIILTFAVPKCIGKIRRRNMARSSNYGSLHEDT